MKFRKLRSVLIPLVSIALLMAAGYASLFFFRIQTIDIRGTSTIQGVDALRNQNLLFISTKKVEEELYAANPHVEMVTAKKIFPDILQVEIKQARDRAYIKIGKSYMVLNSAYRISGKNGKPKALSKLVEIRYHQPLSLQSVAIGDSVPGPDIETAIFFIDYLPRIGTHVSAVDIANFYMILLHSDDGDIIVTSEKSKELQYEVLKEAMRQLTISGKKVKSIDVRFDKPVIILEGKN